MCTLSIYGAKKEVALNFKIKLQVIEYITGLWVPGVRWNINALSSVKEVSLQIYETISIPHNSVASASRWKETTEIQKTQTKTDDYGEIREDVLGGFIFNIHPNNKCKNAFHQGIN